MNQEPNLSVYNGSQLIKHIGYSSWRPQNDVDAFLRKELFNNGSTNVERTSSQRSSQNVQVWGSFHY